MKSFFLLIILHLMLSAVFGQVRISGIVTDQKKMPLCGANVFLKESYDGATADTLGHFNFKTNLNGKQQRIYDRQLQLYRQTKHRLEIIIAE